MHWQAGTLLEKCFTLSCSGSTGILRLLVVSFNTVSVLGTLKVRSSRRGVEAERSSIPALNWFEWILEEVISRFLSSDFVGVRSWNKTDNTLGKGIVGSKVWKYYLQFPKRRTTLDEEVYLYFFGLIPNCGHEDRNQMASESLSPMSFVILTEQHSFSSVLSNLEVAECQLTELVHRLPRLDTQGHYLGVYHWQSNWKLCPKYIKISMIP